MNTHSFSSTLFLGNQFFKKSAGDKPKEKGMRENTKVVGVMGFCHFHLLTISYHGN